MAITFQQRSVPFEFNPEATRGLSLWSLPHHEHHAQINSFGELAEKRRLVLYRMGGDNNNAHQSSTPKHGSRRRFMLLRKQEQCPPDTIRVGMDAIQSRDPAVIRGSVSAVAKILHHCANGCILVSGV